MAVKPPAHQPIEQLRYADWLGWGARVGLVVTVLGFLAYASGVVPSAVSPEQLQALWGLPVREYLQHTGGPPGWSAFVDVTRGDRLALMGIIVLAGCSVPPLLALAIPAWRQGDRALAVLCGAEVLVIALAATGWLAGGH